MGAQLGTLVRKVTCVRERPRASWMGIAIVAMLTLPGFGRAQDRSGVLGAGIGYQRISADASGTGFFAELASNINRVWAPVQYRLHLSVGSFRGGRTVPECDPPEAGRCLLEPQTYTHLALSWAPEIPVAGYGAFRVRFAPLGLGVFMRQTAARYEQATIGDRLFNPPPNLTERVSQVLSERANLGWGLRHALEASVHKRPFVLQIGARFQHGFGGSSGYLEVPLIAGFFF